MKNVLAEYGYDRVRRRLMEVAIALMLSYVMVAVTARVREVERAAVPPDDWFSINEVFVPDHRQGENPPMLYDRTIRVPFRGFWIVEVQRFEQGGKDGELFSPACSGSGISEYEPEDYIPENTVTWEWFIGRECAVPPGQYRLRVTVSMKRAGWPEKDISPFYSNMFRVRP